MATVGIVIFLLGATLADSENIYIPIAFIFVGLALLMMGTRKHEKKN